MAISHPHQKCAHFEKGLGPDPCVLGHEDCLAWALLNPNQVQQVCELHTRIKRIKRKCENPEKGEKVVDPLSVTVIGPSSSADDKMDSSDISPTKAPNPALSHPSSNEFADIKTSFLLTSPG